MKLILASDHRGFALKEFVKEYLQSRLPDYLSTHRRVDIIDVGPSSYDPTDDYPDYGKAAITQLGPDDKAILFCGSGHGMDITANRYPYVRAILGFNPTVVAQGRGHENANVLIIPTDWINEAEAQELVDTFLNSPFSNDERHIRRLEKLSKILDR